MYTYSIQVFYLSLFRIYVRIARDLYKIKSAGEMLSLTCLYYIFNKFFPYLLWSSTLFALRKNYRYYLVFSFMNSVFESGIDRLNHKVKETLITHLEINLSDSVEKTYNLITVMFISWNNDGRSTEIDSKFSERSFVPILFSKVTYLKQTKQIWNLFAKNKCDDTTRKEGVPVRVTRNVIANSQILPNALFTNVVFNEELFLSTSYGLYMVMFTWFISTATEVTSFCCQVLANLPLEIELIAKRDSGQRKKTFCSSCFENT